MKSILFAIITLVFLATSIPAYAQYTGNVGSENQTGSYTLEEALEIQKRRIASASHNDTEPAPTHTPEEEKELLMIDMWRKDMEIYALENENRELRQTISNLTEIIVEQIRVMLTHFTKFAPVVDESLCGTGTIFDVDTNSCILE